MVLEIPEDDYRFFERQVEESKIMTSRKTAEDLINSVYGEYGEYGGLWNCLFLTAKQGSHRMSYHANL